MVAGTLLRRCSCGVVRLAPDGALLSCGGTLCAHACRRRRRPAAGCAAFAPTCLLLRARAARRHAAGELITSPVSGSSTDAAKPRPPADSYSPFGEPHSLHAPASLTLCVAHARPAEKGETHRKFRVKHKTTTREERGTCVA